MNRYIQANDAIHAPAKLKRAVAASRSRRPLWAGAAAAVTAAAIFLAVLFRPAQAPEEEQNNFPLNGLISVASAIEVLAQPEYPEMFPAPDLESGWDDVAYTAWQDSRRTQWALRPEDDSALYDFYYDTAREFLTNSDGANALYSPLNLYLALGMLAELTDGNTRAQLLDLLNCGSLEDLRSLASGLWNVNYCDDGQVTSLLASSLWLREDTDYNAATMQTLADTYYASSYRGSMGSQELNNAFRTWLNDNTGGLLSDQIEGLSLDADTVLALASTIYFKASWEESFSGKLTSRETFHAPGGDVSVDFLNNESDQYFYWGEDFTAVNLPLADSGKMWILLPDEGVTVDDLLAGDALALVIDPSSWENRKHLTVDLSIPKFDISCQTDLTEGLQNLGVIDAFDGAKADFSPACKNSDGLYLSTAIHGARVLIDEEGCTGAAYTVMPLEGAAAPGEMETIEFTADRPFLFAVTGQDEQILFLGVVNQP